MASFYAHIENDVVTSVEAVTDSFFNANPSRYTGTWFKVGEGSSRDYCGKDCIYLPSSGNIIPPKPFPSWTLVDEVWTPPTPRPEGSYYWDEPSLEWIEV